MNASSSSDCRRSERKSKKKDKKHKKEKKHKHKKSSHRSAERQSTALELPTAEVSSVSADMQEDDKTFGPALPPHLLAGKNHSKVLEAPLVIGPALPEGISLEQIAESQSAEEDEEFHGPLPIDDGSVKSMTTAQIELEQRALEMKLAKLDPDANKIEANQREEWMLELPDVGLKTGLASLKRTFHTKERPDFTDRSSWTKTPNSTDEPKKSKIIESTKSKAEEQYQANRDAEQERVAKSLKKKHKRDESLYEIHQKKLKKERKEKESSGKQERRPFSRDVDLQINKIDKNQTKSIVDKAKFLDSRFSSGNAKYL